MPKEAGKEGGGGEELRRYTLFPLFDSNNEGNTKNITER